jgi:hypothetical protein
MRRPSNVEIERFLDRAHHLPLSYDPTGIARQGSGMNRVEEQLVTIGRGEADFGRACIVLAAWKHATSARSHRS